MKKKHERLYKERGKRLIQKSTCWLGALWIIVCPIAFLISISRQEIDTTDIVLMLVLFFASILPPLLLCYVSHSFARRKVISAKKAYPRDKRV
jgi:hypothetical protein